MQELPHTTRQKLVSWKVLKDGSVRIQQLLLVAKKEHQKILVGKNGAVIGYATGLECHPSGFL